MAASLQQMLSRSQDNGSKQGMTLITAYEAEQLIEQLQASHIEKVGGAKFMKQHDAIQKLNLQAHYNAQTHSDEFVLELLVSLDKLSVLVQELLVIEAWKERLYPLLKEHLADQVDSATSYIVLYHEAAVANLLEVLLFHRHACEALGEDTLLELADWSMRKLTYLNSGAAHKYTNTPELGVQDVLALPAVQELKGKQAETDFSAALCGLTILRYLTDHITALPLGLMSRLLSTHDAVMALLPLVEAPPWVRSKKGGKTEKFIDGSWQVVPPADRLKITQLDGQVWLSLVNLLVEPACRAKYDPDAYRRGCLLKLQRHLHELLLDQLPVLRQLARVLDEMALGINNPAAAAGSASSKLILEQVPMLREALLHGKDWTGIAQQQKKLQFGPAAKQLAQDHLIRMLESFEMMCQIEQQQQQQGKQGKSSKGNSAGDAAQGLLDGGGANEAAALAAPVKVVCSRQVNAGGMWEHWCELTFSLDGSKAAELVTISSEQAASAAAAAAGKLKKSSNSASGTGTAAAASCSGSAGVHGRRYRLAAVDTEQTRALPTNGKIAVLYMGSVAEALLQLPEVPLRSAAAADGSSPAGLWLTVGLLAADGFALQLRLKKADKPMKSDRVEGSWFAYHPVGGAITVLVPPEAAAAAGGMLGTAAGTAAGKLGAAAANSTAGSAADTAPLKP